LRGDLELTAPIRIEEVHHGGRRRNAAIRRPNPTYPAEDDARAMPTGR
jgi:hypothetical protein